MLLRLALASVSILWSISRYRAGVDGSGKLTGVEIKIFCDSGYSYNESTADNAAAFAKNCYEAKVRKIKYF